MVCDKMTSARKYSLVISVIFLSFLVFSLIDWGFPVEFNYLIAIQITKVGLPLAAVLLVVNSFWPHRMLKLICGGISIVVVLAIGEVIQLHSRKNQFICPLPFEDNSFVWKKESQEMRIGNRIFHLKKNEDPTTMDAWKVERNHQRVGTIYWVDRRFFGGPTCVRKSMQEQFPTGKVP
jgi:hypothetical protein